MLPNYFNNIYCTNTILSGKKRYNACHWGGIFCNRNLISVSCFVCLSGEVLFRWIYNDFPNFIIPDQRRFVSQTTGNMYIAKVEASDVGNYSCFVSSPTIGKSVFSMPIPLLPQIESECCHITHNAEIFPHNCLFKG